jgi:hypothetical protein
LAKGKTRNSKSIIKKSGGGNDGTYLSVMIPLMVMQVRILSGLQKIKVMKVEIVLNTLDNKEWWFDLGLSYQRTLHPRTKRVFTIALLFFSVYVRW